MQRVRYEIDPFNRLVIDGTGREGGLEEFRKVLDGKFEVDANNNLSYRVRAPLSGDETVPHQLRLDGEWSLTDGHELRLTLNKEARKTFGDSITLQGRMIDVRGDSLLFAVTTKIKGAQSTYVLNLQGSWRADANNRLSFHIRREDGSSDILTFDGAWDINKDHHIEYRYEKAALVRKKKESHTLIFSGHWDIKDKARISYLVDGSTGLDFDFSSSAGIFGDEDIKYEVGITLERRTRPVKRAIVLSGRWRVKKGTGLLFEIAYADNKTCAITFGAEVALVDDTTVSFRLKDGVNNKDLDISLEISRKMLEGGGEMFLRALASRRELALYAGAAWRW